MYAGKITFLRKKSFASERGFTLVEIIIVMVTMALLLSIGYANFRGFQTRQRIVVQVRKIESDLRLAQEYGLAHRKICTNTTDELLGYEFNVTSATTYTISAVCNNAGTIYNVAPPVKSETIPIDFSISAAPVSAIRFNVLGKGAFMSVAGPQYMLNVTDTITATTRQITVTRAGNIQHN